MQFEFATATRIAFGPGALRDIGALAKEFGRRALIVTGKSLERAEKVVALLRPEGMESTIFSVPGEPDIETVERGAALARRHDWKFVIAIGGGSAIDTGKAIAAMLTNEGSPLDYLEVIGRGKALAKPSAPFIAVPTTSGTGSEVTKNAVLGSPQHRLKVSLRSPFLLPRLALVDPELTHDLPPAITASTGMDALTQLIEPYVCSSANPATDGLCVEGIRRAARSLRRAYDSGTNAKAREDMCVASLFGGLALANAGLGAVHGFAGPIGGMFAAPHGAICATLLPQVMEANIRALEQRQPKSESLRRYGEIGRLLTGRETATGQDGVDWVRELVSHLRIPGLGEYGVTREAVPELVEKSVQASSMKANPVVLSAEELTFIIKHSL